MWIVEMNPEKKWYLLVRVHPCESARHDFAAAAFDGFIAVFSQGATMETGIVGVKSAVKTGGGTGLRIENQRSDECRSVISAAAKDEGVRASLPRAARRSH